MEMPVRLNNVKFLLDIANIPKYAAMIIILVLLIAVMTALAVFTHRETVTIVMSVLPILVLLQKDVPVQLLAVTIMMHAHLMDATLILDVPTKL